MIIKSTLQEFIKRVGSMSEVGRMLGVPRQHIHIAIIQDVKVFVEHDENNKIFDCYLQRKWGKL